MRHVQVNTPLKIILLFYTGFQVIAVCSIIHTNSSSGMRGPGALIMLLGGNGVYDIVRSIIKCNPIIATNKI